MPRQPISRSCTGQCGPTATYRCRVLGEFISQKCRWCSGGPETIGHILASCEAHAWGLYKRRHDRVLYQLVRAIVMAQKMKMPAALRAPGGTICEGVIRGAGITVKVDQSIPTD